MRYALGYANCFIMPERIAKTDAFTRSANMSAAGRSVPQGRMGRRRLGRLGEEREIHPARRAPSYFAGGKQVYFDRHRVEDHPDPATKLAALQRGEVDWFENPLFDQLPTLRKDPNIRTEVIGPLAALGVVAVNHELPPFDNPKLRLALLPALDQDEYMSAVLGTSRPTTAPRPASSSPARPTPPPWAWRPSPASATSHWPGSWSPRACYKASRSR